MTQHPSITKKDIFVVLPAYNEGKYIGRVIDKIYEITQNVIVVVDGSNDNTAEVSKAHAHYVLVHKLNLGKGAALKTGCEFAFGKLKAKAVVFMDSDDQHNPQELELFFRELKKGNELIFGVRNFSSNMPLVRIFGNRLASYVVYLLYGTYVPDIPSGFKAMTKNIYKRINWDASDYGVELEIAVKTSKGKIPFSVVPISTIYHEMDRGMTLIDVGKMIFHMLAWRLTI